MTRAQDDFRDQLAMRHGRVHIGRPGVTLACQPTGTREMTIPSGKSFVVAPDGRVIREALRFDIDWSL